MPFALKVIVSALLIAAISEWAKRSTFVGALTASLPLISVLAMIWLWHDTHDPVRVARFAGAIFWMVLPSLTLFALLPFLLTRWQVPFPWALAIGCGATALAYWLMTAALKRLGIEL